MLQRLLTILQHIEFITFMAFETLISGLNKAFKKKSEFSRHSQYIDNYCHFMNNGCKNFNLLFKPNF